jgi:predicted Zn-dependent peptidase
MSRSTLRPAALLALALAAAPAAAARPRPARPAPATSKAVPAEPLRVHREVLEDGTELVVVPMRNVRRASLRYVVRAGAGFDPPGKDGLAHLLEHVIASGREGPDALIDDVRVAGGAMNAYTSHDATVYVLDAPSAAFPALAERLVAAVTNPRLDRTLVAREQAVVASEDVSSHGGGALGIAEDVIFRTPGSTIGNDLTRDNVTREELAAFFQARYVTPATTIVLAGDLDPEAARGIVERGFHLPPALPTERFAARVGAPMLPAEDVVRAPLNAVIVGYRVDDADRAACGPLAELLGLRIAFAFQVRRPVLAGSRVACHTLRGNLFLLAFAYSRSLETGDLPTLLDQALRQGARQPMTAAERRILDQRRARGADWLRDAPDRLSDALAALAALPREGGPTPLDLLDPPLPSPATLQDLARRAFQPARKVSISASPMGN